MNLRRPSFPWATDNWIKEAANIAWLIRAVGYSVFAFQRLTKKHLASAIENKTPHHGNIQHLLIAELVMYEG